MDLLLDDERKMLVTSVRDFVCDVIPRVEATLDADADEVDGPVFRHLVQQVQAMGLHNFQVPAEFGGPGLDLLTQTLISIEVSQHRAGLYAPCYGAFGASGAALAHLYEGDQEQRARYLEPVLRGERRCFFALTESSGGSDPARAIRMRARRDGRSWVLNGSKSYITGADRADFGVVFARTGDDGDVGGVTCFIVPTRAPGFSVRRIVRTISTAHYATELDFDDVRVDDDAVLGELHGGLRVAARTLTHQRIPYAARCVGVAIKAQALALEWARQRQTFGATLSTRQAIQWMLVDNDVDIRHARWAVLDAAATADAGRPFRAESAVAKLAASEAASRVVDRCIQIFGAAGVSKDLPLERWYREMRIRRIGEGSSEVQRMVIARALLGDAVR